METPRGGKGADLISNNLAQACIQFISHSGSCADSGHPSRLRHTYHASSLTETRAPIPCLIQKLRHLHSVIGVLNSSQSCKNISVEDHGLQHGDKCKVYVCRHVRNSDPIHLHDFLVVAECACTRQEQLALHERQTVMLGADCAYALCSRTCTFMHRPVLHDCR